MNAHASLSGLETRIADLRDAADLRRLDAFVLAHADAQPFHRPQWTLAVEQGCRQKAHYLVAEAPSGAIEGVLPLSEIRSALFGSALVSTGFGVGGGMLTTGEGAETALEQACLDLAAKCSVASIELRGGPIPAGFELRSGLYAGFVRDIPSDEEAILTSIPRKQRAEVRKALSLDMAVSIGRSDEDLDAHFRVYAESVRNLGTPVFPRGLFRAMLAAFGEDANILTVLKDGEPVASVFSLYFGNTVYPYWGGGTHAARGLRANELMYFALMRHAAQRGCTRFDFGRSKVGTGAFSYKRNWGFEPAPLTYGVGSLGKAAPRQINPLDPRFSLQIALWKQLPLALANRIGPLIARGLG